MKKISFFVCCFISLMASAQVHTVTFQPGAGIGQDASVEMLDSTNASWAGNAFQHVIDSTHYGMELQDYAWTVSGCPCFERILMRFAGLNTIPTHATISSAKLTLYGMPSSTSNPQGNSNYAGSPYNSYGSDSGWLYQLTDSFDVRKLTWRNQPGFKHTDSVAVPQSTLQWSENLTLDVTSIVSDMLVHGNTGFLIKLQTEAKYRGRLFACSSYSDTTLHPSLQVTYANSDAVNNINESKYTINVYPNPVHDNINLTITAAVAAQIGIKVYDVAGKILYSEQTDCRAGDNNFTISTTNWITGLYILDVSSAQVHFTKKITKLN